MLIRSTLLSFTRSLAAHPLYALLNICGLALGIAVFLALMLYVRDERGYDSSIAHADRIYLVTTTITQQGFPDTPLDATTGTTTEELQADFPQLSTARLWRTFAAIRQGANTNGENIALVDPAYMRMFGYRASTGDAATSLLQPGNAVITEEIARKYFGSADAIGRTLDIAVNGTLYVYTIAAILPDPPQNLSFRYGIYVPLVKERFATDTFGTWGSVTLNSFVELPDDAAARALEAQLPAFVKRHAGNSFGPEPGDVLSLHLQRLSDYHLSTPGDRAAISTMAAVAALTLLIAIVNFVNLATARAGMRAREVAVRKVLGGTRQSLIVQFLSEAVVTVAVATLLGLALVELALPFINSATGTHLALHYTGANGVLLPLAAFVVIIGLLAGAYPAFVLSAFQPAAVLASARAPGGGRAGALLRRVLVILQFAAAIALAIGTAVMFSQIRYLRSADLGFARDGLIVVQSYADEALDAAQRDAIRAAFAAVPGVTGLAYGDNAPGDQSYVASTTLQREGAAGPAPAIRVVNTSPGYFRLYGAHLLAGRLLDRERGEDDATATLASGQSVNVVINETAVRTLGFADDRAAIGQALTGSAEDSDTRAKIIAGVVADMRFDTPRQPTAPTLYFLDPNAQTPFNLMVRYRGTDPQALLATLENRWRSIAPETVFTATTANRNLYESYYQNDDRQTRFFTTGALLALLIACFGLYGLAAFDTTRRIREIGIRKTLGASTRDILRLLIGQFLRPVLIASLLAWPLAWIVMRGWLSGFSDRIGLSPLYFVLPTLVAVAIAALTVCGQSLRVARALPAYALRQE